MHDLCLGEMFLAGADEYRYMQLQTDIANAYSVGRMEYPTSLAAAYQGATELLLFR